MATIDLGSGGARRSVSHDLPLVPFIDFLLCIVAFLLVTAVWSRMARLDADALAPAEGPPLSVAAKEPVLHIEPLSGDRFRLSWKSGATVVSTETVASRPVVAADGTFRRPDLATALKRTFAQHGVHRGAGDPRRDRAVLHAPNDAPFSDVVAVLDAVHAPHRTVARAGAGARVPAFSIAFATD
jgi:biopolymer transport protein ExbD